METDTMLNLGQDAQRCCELLQESPETVIDC